jgi:phosphate-selective porin OprO/OprP
MRLSTVWVAAFAAAGLSLQSTPLLAQNPSVEDELRKEIQELHNRLEQLEKKLDQRNAQPATAVPVQPAQAQPSDQERALQQRVEELDQQVKVLGRKQELQQEDAATAREKEKTSASVTAGPSGFGIKSADDSFRVNLKGTLQVDARFYNGTRLSSPPAPGTQTPDTFLIRRARPILSATLYDKYDFYLMPDFGVGKTQLFDAYFQARFIPEIQLRAGKFKSPVGLEQLQEDVNLTFAERSLANDLVPNRDIGAQLQGFLFNDTLNYQIGVFNGEPDGTTQADLDSNSGKDFEARLFAKPFKNGSLSPLRGLGVGFAFTDGRQTGTTAAPNLPTYVTPGQQTFFAYNTGAFANGDRRRLAPQAYYYWGPFGLLTEYIQSAQEVSRGGVSRNIQNHGWQVNVGWVLTGEDAGFDGVTPSRAFIPGRGGWGAWQVVARYSQLTVDDDAFIGSAATRLATITASARQATDTGIGLNWYVSRWIRVYLDYDETKFVGGSTGGDRPNEKVIISRFQIAF